MQTKFFLCLVLCSCAFMPACGGLLERVEQVRSVHDQLTEGPAAVGVKVTPTTADIVDEAKHQAFHAAVESAQSDASDPEDTAAKPE